MRKVKVLFVCYGNICRSPMAEYAFRDIVETEGLSDRIECASCSTSAEHIGDPVDLRAVETLGKHGISCREKRARRLNRSDYSEFDYILGMDRQNMTYIMSLNPGDGFSEIAPLLSYAGGGYVADPWYTGDFDRAYDEIREGCAALLAAIRKKEGFRWHRSAFSFPYASQSPMSLES